MGVDSMDIESICKSRRISKADIETPLLVPSFSSAVLGKTVGKIHKKLKEHIPDASLVSAYDIKQKFIKKEEIWVSDIVFIDSGNHETTQLAESVNLKEWTPSIYSNVIDTLKPLTAVVLVNYDKQEPLKEQILNAQNLFVKYPGYATCFLFKASSKSKNVTIGSLVENITLIESFDILGLTEKELGNSLLKRCKNLLRIREALNSKGSNVPIHIFGCLDPLGILSYFLCGADIFDGTIWLKFSFHENIAIYVNNHAILTGSWSESDSSILASTYVLNLNKLTHLMYNMRRFTREYDFGTFRFSEDILKEVKDLTGTAGLNIR